ncbi:MAG: hypothetical protein HY304_00360 [candidate division Zixibacteria bacterium]|nr:hypothetical protein [candidate division Zixibacteria bacterium]
MKRGLIVTVVIPFGLFTLAYLARERGLGMDAPAEWEPLLFYILLVVAAADVGAGFLVRGRLFAPSRLARHVDDDEAMTRQTVGSATVLFLLGAMPMVYGTALYCLGGDTRQVAFFAIGNLLSFRLLRPSAGFLEQALRRASVRTNGSAGASPSQES